MKRTRPATALVAKTAAPTPSFGMDASSVWRNAGVATPIKTPTPGVTAGSYNRYVDGRMKQFGSR